MRRRYTANEDARQGAIYSGVTMGPQGPQLRGAQAKRGIKGAHFQAI